MIHPDLKGQCDSKYHTCNSCDESTTTPTPPGPSMGPSTGTTASRTNTAAAKLDQLIWKLDAWTASLANTSAAKLDQLTGKLDASTDDKVMTMQSKVV